ncbi:MAG TPA: diadenylate cyclase [Vicinamibacterales bacterium]|nr:diadenylate cyclase [Vicinamibacterales bacterium]
MEQLRFKPAWCRPDVLEGVLDLAIEIAREGSEGRRVGALFTLGRSDEVLANSRPLILDPLAGHSPGRTQITNPDLRGTVKELATLDGAFVVTAEGTVVASCRYLDVPSSGVEPGLGLGSRHLAAAAISGHLQIVAVVVSQSGVVRVYCEGKEAAVIDATSGSSSPH